MNLVEQTASDQEAQSPLITHGDLQRQLANQVGWLVTVAISGWTAAGLLAIALLGLHGCREQHAISPSPSTVPATQTPVSLGAAGLGAFVSGGVESRHAPLCPRLGPADHSPIRSRSSARPAHVSL